MLKHISIVNLLLFSMSLQADENKLPFKEFSIKGMHWVPDEFGLVTEKECEGFAKTPESTIKAFFQKAAVRSDLDYYGSLCALEGELVADEKTYKWRLFKNKIGIIDLGKDKGGEWIVSCADCKW